MRPAASLLRLFLLAAALALAGPAFPAVIEHELTVRLDPPSHRLSVTDKVRLPEAAPAPRTLHFLLHAGLSPRSLTEGVTLARSHAAARAQDFLPPLGGGEFELPAGVSMEHFKVELPAGVQAFALGYAGEIHHAVREAGEEYARGFGVTPGLIAAQGVVLSGSTLWIPWFGPDLVRFTLEAEVPGGWDTVSQGARTRLERGAGRSLSRWESPEPQDEVYLVAGPWTEYRRTAGDVEVSAFLRKPDAALAGRYLEATGRYLEMYGRLIGPYPYRKFALVENFWETGYGMPSFTLLGPSVIRFPFILTTSYPHEIVHNWWGNGVYVDYRSGNWAEGLTAYLADHLLAEQRGEAVQYRQTTLQKYADYAARAKDFPLTEFLSRHSAATEAVGYGKALFFFHMLRLQLGEDAFRGGIRKFYQDNRFRPARYEDLRKAFEAASGADLRLEFQQWVETAGAPVLRLAGVTSHQEGQEHVLEAVLEQVQEGEPYRLRVPMAVTLEGRDEAFQTTGLMEGKRTVLFLRFPTRPLRVDVDPEFDVFRRLAPAETPPALSGLFGADRILIVLPARAPEPLLAGYRELADSWKEAKPAHVEVKSDTELEKLPADRAVWVLGWENRFLGQVDAGAKRYGGVASSDRVGFDGTTLRREGHAAALALPHPHNPELLLGWVAADRAEALPGLGRKLPHYHKWSYLAFEGSEPVNVAKGRWPAVGSPLSVELGGGAHGAERAKLAPRRALAELPAVFSREAMLETIRALSDPALGGRAVGTPGLDRAADLIEAAFRSAGLEPAGDGGSSFFQAWEESVGGQSVRLRNVVGVLPGAKPEWQGQSVVVGAHYDGQGLGLPGGRSEDRGAVHPGADDNGSGVAVLIELARALKGASLGRGVVFVAFTGEELGRLGSRRYVAIPGRYSAREAIGAVNLDTVGRLGGGKLLVLGSGSAREWAPAFRGAGIAAGVEVECVPDDVGGSDQVSFFEAGVPAVQLFSGPHLDYHRPGDTPEKIDGDGLLEVVAVAKQAVEYLANRAERLTAAGVAPTASEGPGQRRVSLGIVPDFGHQGDGIKLSGVAPNSPAERAGLRQGDVITRMGETAVKVLRDLSTALQGLGPGDELTVTFQREGEERKVKVRVEAR